MMSWQAWRGMAQESEKAARLAEAEGCLRAAASRYYYAAYQAATALLLYRGVTPPTGREAWNHENTPELVREQLEPLIRSRDRRNDLAHRLGQLYKLRILADYVASRVLPGGDLEQARKSAAFFIKGVGAILPQE